MMDGGTAVFYHLRLYSHHLTRRQQRFLHLPRHKFRARFHCMFLQQRIYHLARRDIGMFPCRTVWQGHIQHKALRRNEPYLTDGVKVAAPFGSLHFRGHPQPIHHLNNAGRYPITTNLIPRKALSVEQQYVMALLRQQYGRH
jgi:hypothetical protein